MFPSARIKKQKHFSAALKDFKAAKVDALKQLAALRLQIKAMGTDEAYIDYANVGDMTRIANKLKELVTNE